LRLPLVNFKPVLHPPIETAEIIGNLFPPDPGCGNYRNPT
jgi:hypothetical protein